MAHGFDLIPFRDNRALTCWLDTPIERVAIGCVCGWEGPTLALPAGRLGTFVGEMSLSDTEFDEAYALWQARHAAALVPAVATLGTVEEVAAPA
jgi:hypothetical protein